MKKFTVILSVAVMIIGIAFLASLLSAAESDASKKEAAPKAQVAQPNIATPKMPEIPRMVFLKPGEKVVGPDGLPVNEQPVRKPAQGAKAAAVGAAGKNIKTPPNPAMRFEMISGELISVDSKDPASTIVKIKTAEGKEVEASVEPYVKVMKMYKITELPKGELLTLHCMADDVKKTLRAVSISSGKIETPNRPPLSRAMPKSMPEESKPAK